jgi:hypothetical protein
MPLVIRTVNDATSTVAAVGGAAVHLLVVAPRKLLADRMANVAHRVNERRNLFKCRNFRIPGVSIFRNL